MKNRQGNTTPVSSSYRVIEPNAGTLRLLLQPIGDPKILFPNPFKSAEPFYIPDDDSMEATEEQVERNIRDVLNRAFSILQVRLLANRHEMVKGDTKGCCIYARCTSGRKFVPKDKIAGKKHRETTSAMTECPVKLTLYFLRSKDTSGC